MDTAIGRFDYRTKEVFGATVIDAGFISFIVAVEGAANQFIIGSEHQAKLIEWDGRSPTANIIDTLFEVENDASHAHNMMHVAEVDPDNRLYFSTTRLSVCQQNSTIPPASFYVYTKEKGVQRIFGGMAVAAGAGWNLEKKLFFGVDACARNIIQLSYTDDGIYCTIFN